MTLLSAARGTLFRRTFTTVSVEGFNGAVGNTPLIYLKGLSEKTGSHIYGKAEFQNPGGSVKDRAALGVITDAEQRGLLKPGGTVVEGTAGNTGIGLAHVCRARGYRCVIFMPNTQSQEKIDLLRMLGAEVYPVPAVAYENPANYNHQARDFAKNIPNAVWTDQFDNTANAAAHYKSTGPEIWEQTKGELDGFICATGTGGTLAGAGKYLKEKSNGKTQVWLADPPGSVLTSYFNSGGKLIERTGSSITEGIGQGRITNNLGTFANDLDGAFTVPDTKSIATLYDLLDSEGLYLGASSALNVVAAAELAVKLGKVATDKLAPLRPVEAPVGYFCLAVLGGWYGTSNLGEIGYNSFSLRSFTGAMDSSPNVEVANDAKGPSDVKGDANDVHKDASNEPSKNEQPATSPPPDPQSRPAADAHPQPNGKEKPSEKTTENTSATQKSPQKPSAFSRFIRKLIPCIPSSPRSQPIEVDEPAPSSKEKSKPSSTAKPPETVSSDAPKQPEQTAEGADQPAQSDTAAPPSHSLPPLTVPPASSSDAEVIVPPTPTNQLLPVTETEGVTSGAVQPPGSSGTVNKRISTHSISPTNGTAPEGEDSEGSSFTEDEELDDAHHLDDVEDEEERLIMNGGAGIPIGPDGVPKPLLPPIAPQHAGRKCLVLDLDETLSIQHADFVVPVEIEYHWHNVYVIKRPGVDNFLKKMGELYEIVVFTASLSKYADPVLDRLDTSHTITHRLFRESCYNHRGNYVKDLSQLGRPIGDTIILDNSPASYIFHPNNAVPVSSWFNDPHDTELTDLVPFLADLGTVDDVRGVLDGAR
ncbi:hypothetical protein V5O48_006377 [Marasmius crinis-equi]|uniref:FCP1 homology domain-containing protein n=1 Tax=Marasmius crinis-equi TaxID=585013 RepID=A0ABR3FJP3_9AGAR